MSAALLLKKTPQVRQVRRSPGSFGSLQTARIPPQQLYPRLERLLHQRSQGEGRRLLEHVCRRVPSRQRDPNGLKTSLSPNTKKIDRIVQICASSLNDVRRSDASI
eukprot:TRINITY_DN662_c0_g2_i12.p1 TRINITY_DN662_c0_g2~~TRINITY_DN662_c0_g2_i12.p1  ORF type:complete len:106 (+),score=10.70 TRINITY_DN662_c0_g2_i12:299-616(+)